MDFIEAIKKAFDVLKMQPTTNKNEVLKQRRKMAMQYHLNKSQSPDAEKKMTEINVAFDEIMANFDEIIQRFSEIMSNLKSSTPKDSSSSATAESSTTIEFSRENTKNETKKYDINLLRIKVENLSSNLIHGYINSLGSLLKNLQQIMDYYENHCDIADMTEYELNEMSDTDELIHAYTFQKKQIDFSHTYKIAGNKYANAQQWREAIMSYTLALEVLEKIPVNNLSNKVKTAHIDVLAADLWNSLGVCYYHDNTLDRAVECGEESVKHYKPFVLVDTIRKRFIISLGNFLDFCQAAQAYEKLIPYEDELLKYFESSGGDYLESLNSLIKAYRHIGETSKLILLYEKKINFLRDHIEKNRSIYDIKKRMIISDRRTCQQKLMMSYWSLAEIYSSQRAWPLACEYYSLANDLFLRISISKKLSNEWMVKLYFAWIYASVENKDLKTAAKILHNAPGKRNDLFSLELYMLVFHLERNKEKDNIDFHDITEKEKLLHFALGLARTYVHLDQLSHAQYYYEKIEAGYSVLLHMLNQYKDPHNMAAQWVEHCKDIPAELEHVKHCLVVTKDRCKMLHSNSDWHNQVESLLVSAILAYQENDIVNALNFLQTARGFYKYHYFMSTLDDNMLGDLFEIEGDIRFSEKDLDLAKESYKEGLRYQKKNLPKSFFPVENKIEIIEAHQKKPMHSIEILLRKKKYANILPHEAYSHKILEGYISGFKTAGFFTSAENLSEESKPQPSNIYNYGKGCR